MSFAEMKELLPTLSVTERTELHDCLCAFEEGISVEEYRAIRAAIDEALMDPSPSIPVEEVYEDLKKLTRDNAPSA